MDQSLQVPQPVICENTLHLCKKVTSQRFSGVGLSTQWDMFDLSFLLASWNTSGLSTVTSEDLRLSFPQIDIDPAYIYRLQGPERPLLVSWRRPELPQVLEHIGVPTRRRRHSPYRTQVMPGRQTGTGTCSLKSWKVSFHELGWNWILRPEVFIANYCGGECFEDRTPSADMNFTGNALMRVSYRQVNRALSPSDESLPAPHCAAVSYDSVHIVYCDTNSTIRMRAMEEMVATACACV